MHPGTAISSDNDQSLDKIRLLIYEYHQDDPKKCTAARLIHLHLAQRIRSPRQLGKASIILDPTAEKILTPDDRAIAEKYGMLALDCSWNRADSVFKGRHFRREDRRLPLLLAGNPINYATVGKLSTVEALASALRILGFNDQARTILAPFKWGSTFEELNRELLDAYARNDPVETRVLEEALIKIRARVGNL